MRIDWITVAAQIANFLVLAWLLHRFLYGPITRAMDRREQRIAQRLSDAAEKRADAESEARSFHRKQEELEKQRDQFLADAREQAERERHRLHQEARDETDGMKKAWLLEIEQQREEFFREIRDRVREHFYVFARRALGDLADADLEEQMSHIFCNKLAELDNDTRKRIAAAGRKADGQAVVYSAFAVPPDTKGKITKSIRHEILADAKVTFEQRPDSVCGLELKMGGQTVTWSVDSYLAALEDSIEQDLGTLPPSGDWAQSDQAEADQTGAD